MATKRGASNGVALPPFNAKKFLKTIGAGRNLMEFKKKEKVYSQGESCSAVYYIQSGKFRLSVVSKRGKEATVAILAPKEFFGESCITGHNLRLETATALTDGSLLKIEKTALMEALHLHKELADVFLAHVLARNVRFQEDLVDQLFNSSEKRLARILLVLAHYGKEGKPEPIIPKISQEVLAEMVGTSRSRVSSFMNKFRRMGFIEYNGRISVNSSLLAMLLHD
ncbi:MAG: Crp/Fnr family transcriptional regulator [Acidobacteriales bacterium]|nr:Crp/Fnr family transcriptional regulator [Terriglobales bacterium]